MGKYWLLDQFDVSGPAALVETDGSLHILGVVRFGPGITKLADQQKIWDAVIGQVAPTLKPCVDASSIDETGVVPHDGLVTENRGGGVSANRGRRGDGRQGFGADRQGGGARYRRSRGDR